jgi:hypothetical protein
MCKELDVNVTSRCIGSQTLLIPVCPSQTKLRTVRTDSCTHHSGREGYCTILWRLADPIEAENLDPPHPGVCWRHWGLICMQTVCTCSCKLSYLLNCHARSRCQEVKQNRTLVRVSKVTFIAVVASVASIGNNCRNYIDRIEISSSAWGMKCPVPREREVPCLFGFGNYPFIRRHISSSPSAFSNSHTGKATESSLRTGTLSSKHCPV